MGLFEQFPYSNFHELNADWLLKKMKELAEAVDTFIAEEAVKFADPIIWNISSQYAKSTIVMDPSGNAYISKQPVPSGVQLNNGDYWLEVFNFADYVRTANQNLTAHVESDTTRATAAYNVDDWLLWDDVLYKVTIAIAVDDLLVVGTNLVHFTVEDFIKAWIIYANGLIQQYKNDIDASELLYRQQLAGDIASTTSSLQAQLDAAISGATVDSEVINARVGASLDSITYDTLGNAIRSQFTLVHNDSTYKTKILSDLLKNGSHTYETSASIGDLSSVNGKFTPSTTPSRIATENFYYVPADAILHYEIPSTYRTRFEWYDGNNGTFLEPSAAGIYGSGDLPIRGTYFRFLAVHQDGTNIATSEISNIVLSCTVDWLTQENDVKLDNLFNLYTEGFYTITPDYELGGISASDGTNFANTNRIRIVDQQLLPTNCDLEYITTSSDYKLRFYWYDDNGDFIAPSAENLTDRGVLERKGKYFRCIIYNANIQPPSGYENNVTLNALSRDNPKHDLMGKTISILGDSISTYGGSVSDPNNARYSQVGNIYTYPGNRCRYPQTSLGVTDPNQTYWMKAINYFNMELGINDSWAGSRVSWDGVTESTDIGADKYIGSQTRINHLDDNGTPDYILINAGTNDIISDVPLGTVDYTDPSTIVDYSTLPVDTFADAYRTMLVRVMNTYPNARLICMLPNFATYDIEKTDNYCEIVKELCDMFGIICLDTRGFGITPYNKSSLISDGVHYNASGMDVIGNGLENKLYNNFIL